MATDDAEKKKIIIGILNVFAKTGATLVDINNEFMQLEGKEVAAGKMSAALFLSQMENVRKVSRPGEPDRYYSCSENSKHIGELVKHQHDKQQRPAFRLNNAYSRSFQPSRPQVSYADIDASGPGPSAAPHRAGRIQNRRMTSHARRTPPRRSPPKRRNSTIGDDDSSKRYKRSRSKSPVVRNRNDRENHSPVRPPNRDNSPRPNERRSRSPRQNDRRSRSPRQNDRRSRSPRQNDRRQVKRPTSRLSRSPPRTFRSRSPLNRKQSPPNRKRSPENTKPVPKPNVETNPMGGPSTKESVKTKPEPAKIKPKKFKFTVVGDGYIFYMLSDMQDETKPRMAFCNHKQTIVEATRMLETKAECLQKRKKKVLISIGATDLKNNQPLFEMKRDFTNLFLLCDQRGLKPLITTVLCFDTPELKRRADIFNKFLLESFENVIDMRLVGMVGFSEIMSTLNQGNVQRKKKLELGRLQQLVLNVEK